MIHDHDTFIRVSVRSTNTYLGTTNTLYTHTYIHLCFVLRIELGKEPMAEAWLKANKTNKTTYLKVRSTSYLG